MLYRINGAQVRATGTGELHRGLVGQQVQVVVEATTTPFPILNEAQDPIPDSLVTVNENFELPWIWIDVTDPADLYLDWLDPVSGARGAIDFAGVLRDAARAAATSAAASELSVALAQAATSSMANEVAALRAWLDLGVTSHNMFANPSFETDTVGVIASGVTISRTNTLPDLVLSGTYLMGMTVGASPTAFTAVGQDFANEAVPGRWYAARIPFRPSSLTGTRRTRARIVFYDATDVQIAQVYSPYYTASGTGWAYPEVAAQAPEGAVRVAAYHYIHGMASDVPTAGDIWRTDAWIGSEASTEAIARAKVQEYFDGSFETTDLHGYAWEGTAHASASRMIDLSTLVRSFNGVGPDEFGNVQVEVGGGGGVSDHGALAGLGDDDHLQYHTDTRGDARYYTKEQAAALVANSVAAAAPANRDRASHTGFQTISTVLNLESRLAALEAGGGGGAGLLYLPVGADIPLGAQPGGILRIPDDSVPPATLVETISYDSEGATVTCAVPSGVAVGDAVVFVAGFDPASTGGDISVSDGGWSEVIDYSGNHTRDSAAFVYRVTDSTALAALGASVTASYGQTARRMGVVFTIPGSLVASAWPAYTSGSNRSAATINSNTDTGCVVQAFSTATVPFHKVALFIVHDAASDPASSSGFTQVGYATGSSGGAAPRTLTVLIKDLAAAPVPAATVTHSTASSTSHGGGQFIVPVA